MASEHFQEIIQGRIPDFQLPCLQVAYTMRYAEEFVENIPYVHSSYSPALSTLAVDAGMRKMHSTRH